MTHIFALFLKNFFYYASSFHWQNKLQGFFLNAFLFQITLARAHNMSGWKVNSNLLIIFPKVFIKEICCLFGKLEICKYFLKMILKKFIKYLDVFSERQNYLVNIYIKTSSINFTQRIFFINISKCHLWNRITCNTDA